MTKKGEGSIGATRFGEGFVWEDKETEVLYDVMEEKSTAKIWLNLDKRYISKSLMKKLHLKQKFYGLKMTEGLDLLHHINTFIHIIS